MGKRTRVRLYALYDRPSGRISLVPGPEFFGVARRKAPGAVRRWDAAVRRGESQCSGGNCSRKLAGRTAVGAQRDVERGTKPLCGGATHRGSCVVSATENCRLTEATRLARDYDPAMPGPA